MSTAPIVGVHLDLKYAIASKNYLTTWVRELPDMGINTLLIEYEDKFPFRKFPFLRAPAAFTPDELRDFLGAARQSGLRVIPLVQTISHLEFALAHGQLAPLREAPHIATQIDTSNPAAIAFVHDLIDEVLAYHEPDEFIHLAGDEAWHMGHNPRTAAVLQTHGPVRMWELHMKPMIERVIARGKTPIIWDDIFWKNPAEIAYSIIPRQTLLHCWGYGSVDSEQTIEKLRNRARTFHSAGFRTIAGPCLNWGVLVPRHEHCLRNTRGWTCAVQQENMAGLINTAWSCFHVLPHTEGPYIAATGMLARDPSLTLEAAQDSALREYFGGDATDFSLALSLLTGFWEVVIPGKERPVTPVIYGYMDMLLWYGSMAARMAQGAYPLDEKKVDFAQLHRQKIALLQQQNHDGSVTTRLQKELKNFEQAQQLLTSLLTRVTRHRDEAAFLALAAELKAANARLMLAWLSKQQPEPSHAQHWMELGPRLRNALQKFVQSPGEEQLLRMWWEPSAALLRGSE